MTLAVLGPLATAAAGASGYQENVTVDSSQPAGTATTAWLAEGATYQFTVTGTFQYGDGKHVADAECSTADGLTWSSNRYGDTALHLLVDGTSVRWAPATSVVGCDSIDHSYALSYTPTADGPVALGIATGPTEQSSYVGSLDVTVTGDRVTAPPPANASDTVGQPPVDNTSAVPVTQADGGSTSAPSVPTVTGSAAPKVTGPSTPRPAAPSGDNGKQALTDFMLSDQPKATARPENQVVLETARPRGNGFQAPSPLVMVPLLVAAVVLFKPRQTLAFATTVVHRVPTPGRPSSAGATPWRVIVESSPPPSALSPLERPVFSVRTPQPTVKVRFRRRTW